MKWVKKAVTIFNYLLFAFSLYTIFNEYRLVNSGIFAASKVTRLNCLIFCQPVVEFNTGNQLFEYSFSFEQSFFQSIFSKYHPADRVNLYYEQDNPKNVVVNNFYDKWFGFLTAFISILIGVIRSKMEKQSLIF